MARRYDVKEMRTGWAVYDIFTGVTVVISGDSQDGLSERDALELSELLNSKRLAGDRRLKQ